MPRKNPFIGRFLGFRAILRGLVVKIIHFFLGGADSYQTVRRLLKSHENSL